ncbi:SbcC/MukB-like Walker B domain-containing protein [Arthrobacter sp. SAFR-014]|uniref:SbcC/MukB-like Walker B domain-containing protein n=1 Tax=unclassified Arthrobacter TaxID=235627 RepID=UPI003F7CBBA0
MTSETANNTVDNPSNGGTVGRDEPLTVTALDGASITLDLTDDETLRAWRQAAISGGLPEPGRDRWQQLRAGVVNMWEFDAAEYWTADGRAQFVGGNEQGKSTMMTMTTLTMLTGDLSPRYVDTFGESHRTFRYYLEPTDDPKDRRPTKDQLNRGWTWVEYGRRGENGPEFFTTLLFVQARRTSPTVAKHWITHRGPERIRAGLTLLREQATVPAADLPTLPGLTRHPNGQEYVKTVASVLFGFTDPQRLRTVVELLKTLRTPKLGNRLNPSWVVDRIREALPPLDTSEINELADGWDQLGQLAQDRDDAREAQEAVTAYLRSTWNPWADALLRRAADDLVSAVTILDGVTRERSRAEQQEKKAREECEAAEAAEQENEADRRITTSRRNTLIASRAYHAAAAAGRQVVDLTEQAKRAREDEGERAKTANDARAKAHQADGDFGRALGDLEQTQQELTAQVELAATAGTGAGLPDAAAWAAAHDSQRLLTAIRHRSEHVAHARRRADKVKEATNRHERTLALLADAERREHQRQMAHEAAEGGYESAAQALSDELEAWAAAVSQLERVAPPNAPSRERWLAMVISACEQPRPAQTLARLVRDEWLTPELEPVTAAAITSHNAAAAAIDRAEKLNAEASEVEAEPTPVPTNPHLWQRRTRPTSGPAGAPLWELLDPLPHLTDTQIAGLEAALAGAGLLDAWVTPDGLWAADRDGHEQVLTLATPSDHTDDDRLRAVLTLAEKVQDGQPLAALARTAGWVLDSVIWHKDTIETADTRASGTNQDGARGACVHVASGGSWMTPTTTGRAVPSANGASLLGASARETARARRVSELREQAHKEREDAEEHTRNAERNRELAERLHSLAQAAPDDIALIDAARALASAATELEAAQRDRHDRNQTAEAAEGAKDQAQADLVEYAAEHNLIVARLPETETALHQARLEADRLGFRVSELAREQRNVDGKQLLANQFRAAADEAEHLALVSKSRRENLDVALQAAEDALESTDQELLANAERLDARIEELEDERKKLNIRIRDLGREVVKATSVLETIEDKRREAEESRTEKLAAWWVPVDAGFAAARGIDTGDATRTLSAAVNQVRALRADRRPPRGWPDTTAGTGGDKERDQILNRLRDRLSGQDLVALNNTLHRTGGRTAFIEHDEDTGLPQVRVMVDSSGTTLEPAAAVRALEAKAAELGELHDEQMHEVMQELLSSTFVDHLRAKVKETEKLINDVNVVLSKHPTGTTRTVVRLQRKAVPEHVGGYHVLQRLLTDGIDSPAVQEQVQTFLAGQIRAAQDEGHATGQDWKELVIDNLDYRNWFAVVTEWRVLASAKEGASQKWTELTTARHGQDSGGGKVMTMVQPLLATLATLYQTSQTSPRPLWLDEAFDGLDPGNISSLLGMLVEFDFDFLLAGPKTLVASRHVPCAAVWMVNRAPAPLPGVDLGLWLFAGGTQERLPMAAHTWAPVDSTTAVLASDDENSDGVGSADAHHQHQGLWE